VSTPSGATSRIVRSATVLLEAPRVLPETSKIRVWAATVTPPGVDDVGCCTNSPPPASHPAPGLPVPLVPSVTPVAPITVTPRLRAPGRTDFISGSGWTGPGQSNPNH